jgi:hypothetical protein
MNEVLKKYLRNVIVALDQLLNAITGGDEDETISSRLGKCQKKGNYFCVILCWVLTHVVFFWQKKPHCLDNIEEDEGRNELWGPSDGR